jgi:hypothetical protein
MTDASINQKAKAFISYSRDDIDFADQLVVALESFGFDPLIDRHSIPGGEDWKAQLRRMIVEADTIVFVLSPHSRPNCANGRWRKPINSTSASFRSCALRSGACRCRRDWPI